MKDMSWFTQCGLNIGERIGWPDYRYLAPTDAVIQKKNALVPSAPGHLVF